MQFISHVRKLRDSKPPYYTNDKLAANADRQYTEEERAFLQAIDRYKRQHRRPFPSWIEILDLLKGMGYRCPSWTPDESRKTEGVIDGPR